MHPEFHQASIRNRRRELAVAARRAERGLGPDAASAPEEPVLLRLGRVHDGDALARLAAFNGIAAPEGCFVVVELGGEVVAAQPLDGGPVLADPFRHTSHLLPLLELRARQLTAARRPARRQLLSALIGRWSGA